MTKATGSQRGCPGTRTNCILPRRARAVYTRCNVRHNPVVTLVALAWQVAGASWTGQGDRDLRRQLRRLPR